MRLANASAGSSLRFTSAHDTFADYFRGTDLFSRLTEVLGDVHVLTGDSISDDYAHDGEEFAYVLSGELVFTVEGVEHTLVAGDCIHWKSTVPHLVRNDGDMPAEVVWVLTPRLF